MELKILSPQEGGFVKEIRWNNEELKAEVAKKVEDYKHLAYTEDTIKDAKEDRATLNKLVNAIEDERKRIKKICLSPVEKFEAQVKELVSLVNEPIQLIDRQIKEVEEQRRGRKRKEIETLFESIGFQPFVKLDMIFDNKWLNASMPLTKIEGEMKTAMYEIGNDVATINRLPEFSFEAMEEYKKTMDINRAIQEGQRLVEIQKRKAAYEEEQRRRPEAASQSVGNLSQSQPKVQEDAKEPVTEQHQEQLHTVDFRVVATTEQLGMLKKFLQDNNINYGPVPKKGE